MQIKGQKDCWQNKLLIGLNFNFTEVDKRTINFHILFINQIEKCYTKGWIIIMFFDPIPGLLDCNFIGARRECGAHCQKRVTIFTQK